MQYSQANLTNHSQPKWPLLGSALTMVSFNIERLTPLKEIIIAIMVREQDF